MSDPFGWLVLLVVGVTLVLMLIRPRGCNEAWIALGGAVAMLLIGGVDLGALPSVIDETSGILLFLVGMMTITGIAERAGIFELLAEQCAWLARGRGRRLYVLLFLLGAIITATLSLDVTVIMLTPIIYAVTRRRRLDPLPFMFACVFVANTASLVFPVSNLTNLLLYETLDLSFARFAAVMWLPNLVAALTNLGVFLWLFRNRIPRRFSREPAFDGDAPIIRGASRPWQWTASSLLAITLAGLLLCGLLGAPLWWASVVGAVVLLALAATAGRITVQQAVEDISWPLFVFVIAMTILVRGVEQAWLQDIQITAPDGTWRAIASGVLAGAVGSNVINNVPMTVLARSVLETLPLERQPVLAYAVLVGANIGPALTTYGSLATMLWLTVIRKRGMDVTTADYLRVSLLTVPIVLLTTSVTLWLVLVYG